MKKISNETVMVQEEFEKAINEVLDAANEWETNPDNAGNRTALCAAVRAWRKAGQKLVGHAREQASKPIEG